MEKFEHVIRQNFAGSCLSIYHLSTRLGRDWFLHKVQPKIDNVTFLQDNFKVNSKIITQNATESSCNEMRTILFRSDSKTENNYYPTSVQKYTYRHPDCVPSNSLWSLNHIHVQPSNFRIQPNIQQVATLKTYTFHTLKSKQVKKKPKAPQESSGSSIFEKLRRIYRETVKLKINKTIMKKKKSCHLCDLALIEKVMFDNQNKEKYIVTKESLSIDRSLANHLLKQAAKKESPDPNVSLNSPCYPYIPCPLKKPADYTMPIPSICSYEHTSLAPLFTVDPIIINKEKKKDNEKDYESNCIKLNFWNQFANNKNVEIKEVTKIVEDYQAEVNKPDIKPQPKVENSRVLQENKCKHVPETGVPKLDYNMKPVETTEIKKTVEVKSPLQDSNQSKFIGKYYSVSTSKLAKNTEKTNTDQIKLPPNVFPKKTSKQKVKNNKHLNLNFPYQMTCPNQAKRIKKPVKEADLIKEAIAKEAEDKLSKGSIPKYNSAKLFKQLKKMYDNNGNDTNKSSKADKTEIKQLLEKVAQQKSTDKKIKFTFPLTSPNTHIAKNKT